MPSTVKLPTSSFTSENGLKVADGFCACPVLFHGVMYVYGSLDEDKQYAVFKDNKVTSFLQSYRTLFVILRSYVLQHLTRDFSIMVEAVFLSTTILLCFVMSSPVIRYAVMQSRIPYFQFELDFTFLFSLSSQCDHMPGVKKRF